jgi:phage major head subunit gpT-like protein
MLTPAQFAFFTTATNTMLGAVYDSTPVLFQKFASTVPSDGDQNVYGWTGRTPKPRAWYGPRVVNEPAPQTYTLANVPFENTIKIDRFRLDDARARGDIYWRTMPDLALQAKRWPDFQMRDLLQAKGVSSSAAAQLGLDGLPHWSTAHPVDFFNPNQKNLYGSTTYINDFTAGGQVVAYPKPSGGTQNVTVGGGISPQAIATIVEYQRGLTAEDGEPIGVTPSHILHPDSMLLEVDLILNRAFFANPTWGTITGQVGAAENPMRQFKLEGVSWSLLDGDATTFYSLDCTKSFMPFIWQLREAPTLAQRTQENDPIVFDTHQFLWGYWMRGAAGWDYAFLSARSGP